VDIKANECIEKILCEEKNEQKEKERERERMREKENERGRREKSGSYEGRKSEQCFKTHLLNVTQCKIYFCK